VFLNSKVVVLGVLVLGVLIFEKEQFEVEQHFYQEVNRLVSLNSMVAVLEVLVLGVLFVAGKVSCWGVVLLQVLLPGGVEAYSEVALRMAT